MKIVPLALGLVLAAPFAHAGTISVAFSGTVDDGTYANAPVNTPFTPGEAIAGSFVFNTTTDAFNSFQIGGYTAPAGSVTSFTPPLAATGFAFLADELVNAATGEPTGELSIDFFYEGALANTTNIASFINNPGAFSTDLSGEPSTFSVFLDNPNGSVTTVSGLLTSYAVPEPGAIMLLASAVASLAFTRRRAG
jgi:hypothetical protein